MIPVDEALQIVLARCRPGSPVEVPLSPDTLGRVLAEDVASDLDMPPFDKALMDGYAIRVADLSDGRAVLPVAAEVMAGQAPPPLRAGTAIRIMTGAPIPAGADAVVRVEHTKGRDGGRVEIETSTPTAGQFILRRAAEMKTGDIVLRAGTLLTPHVLGLLASVGRTSARLAPAPALAVLATGDELVEAGAKPGPTQLRNSNGPMLLAQAARTGATWRYLGIAPDEHDQLRSLIEVGLESAVLVLAGGVSMGERDLVPGVLHELGVEAHVHQVAMKPGKPFFFGTRDAALVFGLPGNPVSSFCCFELFVRPALRKLAGHAQPGPAWQEALLIQDFAHRSERPTYHPALLENHEGASRVRPLAWFGSPDLRGLAAANALVRLAAGTHTFAAGTRLPVLPLD